MSNAFLQYYSLHLNFLRSYFDDIIKLLLNLCLAKFLDILAKLFFPCVFDIFFIATS